MKRLLTVISFLMAACWTQAQTSFVATAETFSNQERVYAIAHNGITVGEFWPVEAIDLVTRTTHPDMFKSGVSLGDILEASGGIAVTPGGMTGFENGSYVMQGQSLANGVPCGDGRVRQYGIVATDASGKVESFTHQLLVADTFSAMYDRVREELGDLFFLPSVYRVGADMQPSQKVLDKLLVRRIVPDGIQIGVIIFNRMVTYDEARSIVVGLNRPGASTTTHAFMLDGGGTWGQACKEVNGQVIEVGTRNPAVVTNYLVFY